MPKPSQTASAMATAALIEQQMQTIKRLEREKAEIKINQELVQKHLGNSTIAAKPTNGQVKNAFLPWVGETLLNPESPFFLVVNKPYSVSLINRPRIKESQYGKQWLVDIQLTSLASVTLPNGKLVDKPSQFTWSIGIDDQRIAQLLYLLSHGKPLYIRREEYLDTKENKTKSTLKIA